MELPGIFQNLMLNFLYAPFTGHLPQNFLQQFAGFLCIHFQEVTGLILFIYFLFPKEILLHSFLWEI